MTSLQKSASATNCKHTLPYQLNGTLDSRPKRGPDVKFIIQSLKMTPALEQGTNVSRAIACNPAKMFKSVIQHANDSGSMDTSLEYKPLSKIQTKDEPLLRRKMPYVNELREILKENNQIRISNLNGKAAGVETPSKLPFANRKNLCSEDHTSKAKNHVKSVPKMCERFIDTIKMSKKMPTSSTPYRAKKCDESNNNCKEEINLMTPVADVRCIDSHVDRTDGDFNRTLVKCFSLTRASCRRMASLRKNVRKPENQSDILVESSPKFQRRSLFTSSFNGTSNRSSIVSTNEISPLRRQKNIKFKNSKILNFFRSSKNSTGDTSHESDLTQTCNNLTHLLAKSDEHFEELGCVPLSRGNVDFCSDHADELNESDSTIGGDNQFEFSFICEPSTSDIEEDELEFYPPTESDTRFSNVPFLRVSPPSVEQCGIRCVRNINTSDYNLNSSPFRRSVSDPALIRLATIYNTSTLGLNADNDFNDPLDFYNCATANIVSDFSVSYLFKYQLNSSPSNRKKVLLNYTLGFFSLSISFLGFV